MFFVIVGTLIILSNLAGVGPFADWTWNLTGDLWKLCVPFVLALLWWIWADKSGLNRRREIEKMEQRKVDRRQANLDNLGMGQRGRGKGTRK